MRPFTKSPSALESAEIALAFKRTFELIGPHLYSVEERIRQQARAFDPAIEGYVAYAINSGGKRLRPALALLAGGAAGNISPGHVDLAVIIELIHLATLVHDDIMDGAETRREQATTNAKWGNALSVLLGDCLFAHALKLSTDYSNNDICRKIAEAASEVCAGEIIQTQRRFDLKLSTPDYFKIIEMKTAALFSTACELGAFLSEASAETIKAFRTFGRKLGTAYQVYDDCLDIAGDEAKAGKTLGTDLSKGKLTLPVLILLQASENGVKERVSEMILAENGTDRAALTEMLVKSGAIAEAVAQAKKLMAEADAALATLPANRYLQGLKAVALYLARLLDELA